MCSLEPGHPSWVQGLVEVGAVWPKVFVCSRPTVFVWPTFLSGPVMGPTKEASAAATMAAATEASS